MTHSFELGVLELRDVYNIKDSDPQGPELGNTARESASRLVSIINVFPTYSWQYNYCNVYMHTMSYVQIHSYSFENSLNLVQYFVWSLLLFLFFFIFLSLLIASSMMSLKLCELDLLLLLCGAAIFSCCIRWVGQESKVRSCFLKVNKNTFKWNWNWYFSIQKTPLHCFNSNITQQQNTWNVVSALTGIILLVISRQLKSHIQ